ncbi:MAG: NADPH-dependent 7-cyano-7-deazaguanine reductase QueF [Spirochaetes bacterium]|nr:NADPH-dependent 7-cyano-7-deazaguanine reductase QueF [Spirochaetota bacterium]
MKENPLGKKIKYYNKYDPSILYFISRKEQRKKNNIYLTMNGYDIWNAYELSWLDENGKPEVRIARVIYSCNSEYIVESKSLKLYLNSFSMMRFKNEQEIIEIIKKDLKDNIKTDYFNIKLCKHNQSYEYSKIKNKHCIDNLKINTQIYNYDRSLLKVKKSKKKNVIRITNLLKTNCPITGQPDWGTLYINYKSENIIDDEFLLKYIVSFRNENDYHENCCERIYSDIFNIINPDFLIIRCFYTRRGGIEINPVRFTKNFNHISFNYHFWRQ